MEKNNENIHYDFFKNKLEIGMCVILSYGTRGNLELGKVIKINKKLITIEIIKPKRSATIKTILRYSNDLVIIKDEIAVEYLLSST
jgi:hypothetical protein